MKKILKTIFVFILLMFLLINSIFVLSDVRDNIFDSRIEEIGSVKESDIIGKVILKIYPINNIKFI